MNRRAFICASASLGTPAFAGCVSDDQSEADPSEDDDETHSSYGEEGPVGPEEAVEHYNNAVELLDKNTDEFDEARQQFLLGEENFNFSPTTIASRITEVRNQLDRAAQQDDGSLSDVIETLRQVARYQDALSNYNEEYLKLIQSINVAIDSYFAGQHGSAIESLQSAQMQIEPARSSLENVEEELAEIENTVGFAEMGEQLRESLLMADEDNTEIHEELNWLNDVVPARKDEVQGDLAFERGTDAFENEAYRAASSHYSNAGNHFASAKTHLEGLNVEEVSPYIEALVDDAESLVCEYELSVDASDELQKASEEMRNNNLNRANQLLESADTYLSRIGTC